MLPLRPSNPTGPGWKRHGYLHKPPFHCREGSTSQPKGSHSFQNKSLYTINQMQFIDKQKIIIPGCLCVSSATPPPPPCWQCSSEWFNNRRAYHTHCCSSSPQGCLWKAPEASPPNGKLLAWYSPSSSTSHKTPVMWQPNHVTLFLHPVWHCIPRVPPNQGRSRYPAMPWGLWFQSFLYWGYESWEPPAVTTQVCLMFSCPSSDCSHLDWNKKTD